MVCDGRSHFMKESKFYSKIIQANWMMRCSVVVPLHKIIILILQAVMIKVLLPVVWDTIMKMV